MEHYYKAVKHELGWADFQVRPARAIVRHWQLVMLAYTFSLLTRALPSPTEQPSIPATTPSVGDGKKITAPSGVAGHAPARPRLAVPLGTAALLPAVVQRTTPTRVGGAPRPCRPIVPTPRPNLTNQR
jgi:hypothetical protein